MNIKTNKQEFLTGHTHNISTLEVSPSGRLVASGQINHMGFRAHLIVWDWKTRREILRHELHKVRVQDLCFSSDEEHIISLGGKDCGMIIVWSIHKKWENLDLWVSRQCMLLSYLAWRFVVKWQRERRLAKLQSSEDFTGAVEFSLLVETVSESHIIIMNHGSHSTGFC